jgi:transposase
VADCKEAEPLLDALGESGILLTDKGCDSDAIRARAAERKVWETSRPRQTARAPSPSPPGSTASETSWDASSTVSNASAALPGYDKDPANYLAAVKLVATRIWCQAQCDYGLMESCAGSARAGQSNQTKKLMIPAHKTSDRLPAKIAVRSSGQRPSSTFSTSPVA